MVWYASSMWCVRTILHSIHMRVDLEGTAESPMVELKGNSSCTLIQQGMLSSILAFFLMYTFLDLDNHIILHPN